MKTERMLTMELTRPKLNVGFKTFMALSIVFWVPTLLLAGILFFIFHGIITDEVINSIKIDLNGAKGVYEERISVVEGVFREISMRPDVITSFKKKNGAGLKSLFLNFDKNRYNVDTVIAVDENGTVFFGDVAGQDGKSFNIGNVVTDAVLGKKTANSIELVSKEFIDNGNDRLNRHIKDISAAQFVAVPVRDGEKVLGAIVAGSFLTGDSRLGNTIHSRFGIETALFAGETSESFLLHSTSSVPRNTWVVGQAIPEKLKEEIKLGKPYYGTLEIAGIEHLAAFEPIKDSRQRVIGALGVSVPSKKVNAIIFGNILKGTFIVAVIGLAISLTIAVFVHHDITRPLNFLTNAMDMFGKGETGTLVNLKTGDEFERLGKGFNDMAADIRKREERLKKHNEIAKLLMSTLDFKKLLGRMVQIATSVTESHLGIVYLYDEGSGILIPKCQYGAGAELMPIAIGEGYPGRAALDKQTIVLKPEGGSGNEIEFGFARTEPREAAYIPLIYQDKVLGVLVLGTLGAYSEEEAHLFEYLGNQISIALDNALLHKQVHELSVTDSLTGLSNRRYMNMRLSQEWTRTVRHSGVLSVILADIDNFKTINDTYGHEKGDLVLKAVSGVIKANIRNEDVASRFGGEEFVMILSETGADGASVLAERIRQNVSTLTFAWLNQPVTLSIGIATYPDVMTTSCDELLNAADQAMYRAKITGKNKIINHKNITS